MSAENARWQVREPSPSYVPAEIQPGMGESMISKGNLDTTNRYMATVLVDGGRGACSGVLVAPRVVLTAGHCVCAQREVSPDEAPSPTLYGGQELVQFSEYTSTYFYRAWLRREIANAEREATD